MEKCFLSIHHPSLMVCWWVLVHPDQNSHNEGAVHPCEDWSPVLQLYAYNKLIEMQERDSEFLYEMLHLLDLKKIILT